MSSKLYPGPKVLVLISNNHLFAGVKQELEQNGFEVEELLYSIPQCRFVIMDHFYLQAGIAEYLLEQGMSRPAFLILTQMQMHSGQINSQSLFHDILVIRDNEEWSPKHLISALEGEVSVQHIFGRRLHDFLTLNERSPEKKRSPAGKLMNRTLSPV